MGRRYVLGRGVTSIRLLGTTGKKRDLEMESHEDEGQNEDEDEDEGEDEDEEGKRKEMDGGNGAIAASVEVCDTSGRRTKCAHFVCNWDYWRGSGVCGPDSEAIEVNDTKNLSLRRK